MKTKSATNSISSHRSNGLFQRMPIQNICEPGCYVDNRNGTLIRISETMVSYGATAFHGFTSEIPWYVTKISDDYTAPLDQCRIIAANASLRVKF